MKQALFERWANRSLIIIIHTLNMKQALFERWANRSLIIHTLNMKQARLCSSSGAYTHLLVQHMGLSTVLLCSPLQRSEKKNCIGQTIKFKAWLVMILRLATLVNEHLVKYVERVNDRRVLDKVKFRVRQVMILRLRTCYSSQWGTSQHVYHIDFSLPSCIIVIIML